MSDPRTTSEATAARTRSAGPLYFVNAPVDFFFIGGASVLTFVLMTLFYTSIRTPAVVTAGLFLAWIVNWPHFSMSSYRLYHSRANVRQYPVTALVIPFVVIAGMVGAFASPTVVAPYFVKLFLIWSPYHFSGQTVGITLIYARRAGLTVAPRERLALSAFVFGTFVLSSIRAETSRAGHYFYGIQYPGLGVPEWMVSASEAGVWLAGLAFVAAAFVWRRRAQRPVPLIVLLPAITQYVWFVQAIHMPSFQEFVPMFHALQYILIAWAMQLKERLDVTGTAPSRAYAWTESLRWGALNVAGGVALFYALPRITALGGHSLLFSTAIVLAGVQIHHFFVDGVIWKLKKRTVSHPLMMNVRDVVGPRAPASVEVREAYSK